VAANLILAPEAEQDINDGYAWDEARRVGLGEEFLSCVDACIQTICRRPDSYKKVHHKTIAAPLSAASPTRCFTSTSPGR
jgi:hypothetical protein